MNKNYLRNLIYESTKAAVSEIMPSEKERQKTKSKEMSQFRAEQDEEQIADEGADDGQDQTPVKQKKTELPTIDIATIEDKLNTVRAGKSLDDKGVRKQLKIYLQNLNGNEKIALYAFLDAMAKIISAGEEAEEVPTPHSPKFGVNMKTKEKPKASKSPAGEDKPIVVGEIASKKPELKIISANR